MTAVVVGFTMIAVVLVDDVGSGIVEKWPVVVEMVGGDGGGVGGWMVTVQATDQVVEAVELFKKLVKEKICEPNQVMYGTVVNGLCKAGHTSKALELLRFMEASSCKPNVYQYNTIIDSLCKDKMVDHALEIFAKMVEKGVVADVITYNSLIRGLCNFGQDCSKCGKRNLAMDLFDELCLKGLKPNVRTYTVMISVYCQEGLFGIAKEFVRKREENGYLPNSVTYNVIVQEFLKQNEFQEANIFLEEMIDRGFFPDATTFSLLLHLTPSIRQDSPMQTIVQKLVNL
ncbi:putative pentatricopeptide repeat-containing protein At1g12700, mitochondrial [Helianthus annuus]|uniref:putative pentatricopeptide repeat-containing protein At1g12700, mitochondrial n=1 Tax=Helianthus annuus TaxID=4232 RepID=UPI000B9065CE|nr:putative pentatricopeptide repeat-containing protein At1g12700, mitochondrial [Helianthus annuus]